MVSFAKQVADADFVVVVGALERRDFVVHQRFKFGGARQRALDAVAHRGDFAADGLADIDDGVLGGGFRLGEPHRDFRHGLRDEAQIMGAADGVGEGEEKRDRNDDSEQEARDGRWPKFGLRRVGENFGLVDQQEGSGGGDPKRGQNGRSGIGRLGRAALERLEDLADGGAVVVGGAAHRAVAVSPARRIGRAVKQVGRDRRRDRRCAAGVVRSRRSSVAHVEGVLNRGDRLVGRVF